MSDAAIYTAPPSLPTLVTISRRLVVGRGDRQRDLGEKPRHRKVPTYFVERTAGAAMMLRAIDDLALGDLVVDPAGGRWSIDELEVVTIQERDWAIARLVAAPPAAPADPPRPLLAGASSSPADPPTAPPAEA